MMNSFAEIPKPFEKFFWDTDLSSISIAGNRSFIIERILNMGDGDALKWLWKTYSLETILEVVKNSRRLTRKTARCWQYYFDLKEEQMSCFGTYSMSPGSFY